MDLAGGRSVQGTFGGAAAGGVAGSAGPAPGLAADIAVTIYCISLVLLLGYFVIKVTSMFVTVSVT